jgi:hypothetical protein
MTENEFDELRPGGLASSALASTAALPNRAQPRVPLRLAVPGGVNGEVIGEMGIMFVQRGMQGRESSGRFFRLKRSRR